MEEAFGGFRKGKEKEEEGEMKCLPQVLVVSCLFLIIIHNLALSCKFCHENPTGKEPANIIVYMTGK